MIKRLNTTPPLNLARPTESQLLVDMEAFFDFSFWMAEELQELITGHERKECSSKPKFISATDNFDTPYENWVEWE